jgi:hypothetical protein
MQQKLLHFTLAFGDKVNARELRFGRHLFRQSREISLTLPWHLPMFRRVCGTERNL